MDEFEDATFLTAMSRALSTATNKPKYLVDMINEKLANTATNTNASHGSIPVAAEGSRNLMHRPDQRTSTGGVLMARTGHVDKFRHQSLHIGGSAMEIHPQPDEIAVAAGPAPMDAGSSEANAAGEGKEIEGSSPSSVVTPTPSTSNNSVNTSTNVSKKRNVTWRDSVGDSLCEEEPIANDDEFADEGFDACEGRNVHEVFAGFSGGSSYLASSDDDDSEFPVHSISVSRPKSPKPPSPSSTNSSDSSYNSSVSSFSSPPSHMGLPLVNWSSGPTPIPRLKFLPVSFLISQREASKLPAHPSNHQRGKVGGEGLPPPMKLSYRIVGGTDCQIVRATLVAHGFREAGPTQDDFNIMWANNKIEVHEVRSLNRYQKMNRFPRTNEITRKDKLYLNISRMRQTYGERHFDFLPPTFLLPQEYETFYTCYLRTGGRWIVKPVASSQGRGIHVIDSLAELPSRLNADDKYLVQKYIDNPLLLDGYKFDLRIYVAITSFSPLRIYMFEEGLARMATERYDTNPMHSNRSFMHLTNSSINKQSENYVDNEDANRDDHGHKWSLTALMRYITSKYGSDNASLVKSKIKDIIVKSILSGEAAVSNAVNMFVPHPGNCFELLGFDIIIDQNLTPWLLEINLSPSLGCDTPLDLKIKSALIADLLTMIGIIPYQKGARRGTLQQPKPCRPPNGIIPSTNVPKTEWTPATTGDQKLTSDQQKIVRATKDENNRRGRFTRLFPTDSSAYLYSSFIPKNSLNWTILIALFGRSSMARPKRSESPVAGRNYPRFNSIGAWSESGSHRSKSKSPVRDYVSSAPWAGSTKDTVPSASSIVKSFYHDFGMDASESAAIAVEGQSALSDSSKFLVGSGSTQSSNETPSTESRQSTEEILIGASALLTGSAKDAAGKKDSVGSAKKTAEKIQAREAFHVFLENILGRLKKHYEQSDPEAKMDENDIRQQVAVVDKFLGQAKELSFDSEFIDYEKPLDGEDMPTLTDRLEQFLKAYKRQTEKFKLECLANGKISGTTTSWSPQSASSSRHSSRPSSASKSGRTPIKVQTQPILETSQAGSITDRAKRLMGYMDGSKSARAQSTVKAVTVVPTYTSSMAGQALLQQHIAQAHAHATSTRSWASPSISSKVSSAFPVVYAWSPSMPASANGTHIPTSANSPLANTLSRKAKGKRDVRYSSPERSGRNPKVTSHNLSIQGAKYYRK
ncbi:Tubulin polyglutamylase ttll5 [Phlyctochytrium planicorne]|nr:Tubulin polyglutamylase ttll5 [Phlyctochytrium planicorne]